MIREISQTMYRIARKNMEEQSKGAQMPVPEELFLQLVDHDTPYVIDLGPLKDLPPMDYVNALYYLFQNMNNNMVDHWRKLEQSLSEDEFRKQVTNAFLACENVEKYHIKVLNNPYESKGRRRIRLAGKLGK